MSAQPEDNKAVLNRFMEQMITGGNLDLVEEFFDPDYVDHSAAAPELADRYGRLETFKAFLGAFPDLVETPQALVAEDDMVAVHARLTGTHQGEFLGIPATGRRIQLSTTAIVRFRDGRMLEHWGDLDLHGLLAQLTDGSEVRP